MPAIPAAALVMVQATCALGVLVELLERPAAVRQLDQPVQGRVRWQVPAITLDVAAFPRYRALAEQPAFRSGVDAVMAGREVGAARGPVHPPGHALCAQGHVVVLAPGDRLPVLLRQGLQDGLGLLDISFAIFHPWSCSPCEVPRQPQLR